MADITLQVTIPDAYVPRVQKALGFTTKAQAQTWLIGQIKNAVINYEVNQAEQAENAKIKTAMQISATAVEQAELNAKSIVIN